MSKIKLGTRPKNFKSTVKFSMIEGGQAYIECLFKYRTRKEFGEFIDKMMDAAKVRPVLGEDGEAKFSIQELMERTAGSNADYILQVLDGWDVTDEGDKPVALSLVNLQQFANELPGGAAAIMEAYRAAISEGKSGN